MLDDVRNTPTLRSLGGYYIFNENDKFTGSRFELSVAQLRSPSKGGLAAKQPTAGGEENPG
jgi:hypothetical protein